MKNFMKLGLVCILLFSNSLTMSADKVGNEKLSIKMHLNSTLDDVINNNPQLKKVTKTKPRRSGVLTLDGPIKFSFAYAEDRLLDFENVKLVIYPVEDYKINYIHIFPQLQSMTTEKMDHFLTVLDKQFISAGWSKSQSFDLKNKMVATGLKDYAFYRLQNYEIVLTTFTDDTIKCTSQSNVVDDACPNRFVRVGFYGFHS